MSKPDLDDYGRFLRSITSSQHQEDDVKRALLSRKFYANTVSRVAELDNIFNVVVKSLDPGLEKSLLCLAGGSQQADQGLLSRKEGPTSWASPESVLIRANDPQTLSCLSSQARTFRAFLNGSHASTIADDIPNQRNPPVLPSIRDFTPLLSHNLAHRSTPTQRARRHTTVKHYADATPSTHCHICCRSSKNVTVIECANIKLGVCRKVVCCRCFEQNNWKCSSSWTCPHCEGICPPRSQCYTYERSNMRRRLQASKKRSGKSYESGALPEKSGGTTESG